MSRDYPVCKWCMNSTRFADHLRDVERKALYCTLNPNWIEVDQDHYCSQFTRKENEEADQYSARERDWEERNKSWKRIKELNKQVKRLKERLKKQKGENNHEC